MQAATFHVTGVKGRLPRLLQWLHQRLLLQGWSTPLASCIRRSTPSGSTRRSAAAKRRATTRP